MKTFIQTLSPIALSLVGLFSCNGNGKMPRESPKHLKYEVNNTSSVFTWISKKGSSISDGTWQLDSGSFIIDSTAINSLSLYVNNSDSLRGKSQLHLQVDQISDSDTNRVSEVFLKSQFFMTNPHFFGNGKLSAKARREDVHCQMKLDTLPEGILRIEGKTVPRMTGAALPSEVNLYGFVVYADIKSTGTDTLSEQ